MRRLFILFTFIACAAFGAQTTGSYHGAVLKEDLELAIKVAVAKDAAAWAALVSSGKIVRIPAGKEVQVIDSTLGLKRIRFVGTDKTFWVPREAVKD